MAVSLRSLLGLLAVGLLVAACAAPRGPSVLNRPAAVRPVPASAVIVQPGDTLYAIAQRHGVSPRSLIDANRLRPPYLLRPGDRLVVPATRVHVVTRGDTVSEIAERYGVSMRTIVVMNGLRPPYLIRVGDRVRLPSVPATAPPPASDSVVLAARAPRAAVESRRQPGQPWSGGGQLHFPTGDGARRTADAAVPLPAPRPRPVAAASSAAPSPPSRSLEPEPSTTTARAVSLSPPPKMGGGFRWPLKGRVISGFGPRQGGLHNDGINISAPAGTEIRAAENGIVVYAGSELRGLGNLLLVKHADNWMTAYAHADRLLVGRGDRVTRGQVIATVGQTGNVARPQLHFEIRKGPRPVDPRKQLPPPQVSALLKR